MRLLAVDFGSKHIGLATGTLEGRLAEPWREVRARSSLEATASLLCDLAKELQADAIVLGVPISKHKPRQAGVCLQLARRLEERGQTVHLVNEALSSRIAECEARAATAWPNAGEHALAAAEVLRRFFESWELPR